MLSCSSDYNPELHVLLSKGRYQLVTDKAIYSHEDLYDNFGEILCNRLDLTKRDDIKVLVLGLGLGSIPIILDQIRPGQYDITAVEIDEVICELAATYAYHKIKSPINTVIGDAYDIVGQMNDSFDLICVDLFVGEHTPQKFRSADFLQKLANLLNSDGVVIYNTLGYTKTDKAESASFFNKQFKSVFVEAESIYAHRNYMLISNRHWFR